MVWVRERGERASGGQEPFFKKVLGTPKTLTYGLDLRKKPVPNKGAGFFLLIQTVAIIGFGYSAPKYSPR